MTAVIAQYKTSLSTKPCFGRHSPAINFAFLSDIIETAVMNMEEGKKARSKIEIS